MFKSIATLAALWLASLPGALVLVVALLRNAAFPNRYGASHRKETVLLTGGKMTKALQLARLFKQEGYRVVLAETSKYRLTAHRFSRAVDEFVVIPSPADGETIYTEGLLRAVKKAKATYFVPVASPVASVADAKANEELSRHCRVIHWTQEDVEILDNKFLFCKKAQEFGLKAPQVFNITQRSQIEEFPFSDYVNPFILKSIPYDSVERLDMRTLPHEGLSERLDALTISTQHPWVLQEFIRGEEFCTHGTVIDGKLTVYCCCKSSPFQVNYEHVEEPEIKQWVETFVEHFGGTGQMSFDFIKTPEGEVLPIECNPRTHSAITTFYEDPRVPTAYIRAGDALLPPFENKPTYWFAHELWRLIDRPVDYFREFKRNVTLGKDAVWDRHDPLPFFWLHAVHIPSLLLRSLREGKRWVRIDFNIGKLVEPGGD